MEFCCIDNFQSNSRWHGDCTMLLPVNHTFVEASYTVGGYLDSFRENEVSGLTSEGCAMIPGNSFKPTFRSKGFITS